MVAGVRRTGPVALSPGCPETSEAWKEISVDEQALEIWIKLVWVGGGGQWSWYWDFFLIIYFI